MIVIECANYHCVPDDAYRHRMGGYESQTIADKGAERTKQFYEREFCLNGRY